MGGKHPTQKNSIRGTVPILHKGEATVGKFSDWQQTFNENFTKLRRKYTANKRSVLCIVPTSNRYFTTLPLVLESILTQTVKPDKLIIYDDSDEHVDLRENPVYGYIFHHLDTAGINWNVLWSKGKGQHKAHQSANTSGYDFVWRLDDDTVAEANVLETLLSHMKDDVGGVAGSVVTPGQEAKETVFATKLIDINSHPNIQWQRGKGIVEVEHLYSSFLYRAGIVHYNLDLSRVAHREETMFSHSLFLKGYRLIVDRSATTWHYRNPEGGIRAEKDTSLWAKDEEIFRRQIDKWGYKMIALSHGLGDHFAFVNIIPKMLQKYRKLFIFCINPEPFDGIKNVEVRPISYAEHWGIKEKSIYEWMSLYNWKRSMIEAYETCYID